MSDAMSPFWLSPILIFSIFILSSSAEQKNIPAEPGQDVTLPCRAPNNNNNDPKPPVEWSRTDLGTTYVLLYRDGHFERYDQHPSFKNRVDLQDKQMKDGNVSLVLKNVTVNDTGTYECRVFRRQTKRRRRAHVSVDPINTIYLRVVAPPPDPTGGLTEYGGKKGGGSAGLIIGLSSSALLVVVVVVVVVVVLIWRKQKQQSQGQYQPPAEQQSTETSQTNSHCQSLPNSSHTTC